MATFGENHIKGHIEYCQYITKILIITQRTLQFNATTFIGLYSLWVRVKMLIVALVCWITIAGSQLYGWAKVIFILVGFEVLMAVSMKIAVFWVVAPCGL
jgi:hypothetical protein